VVLRIITINAADTRNEEKLEMAGAKVVMIAVMLDRPRMAVVRGHI
jgi:hypothetical protein